MTLSRADKAKAHPRSADRPSSTSRTPIQPGPHTRTRIRMHVALSQASTEFVQPSARKSTREVRSNLVRRAISHPLAFLAHTASASHAANAWRFRPSVREKVSSARSLGFSPTNAARGRPKRTSHNGSPRRSETAIKANATISCITARIVPI